MRRAPAGPDHAALSSLGATRSVGCVVLVAWLHVAAIAAGCATPSSAPASGALLPSVATAPPRTTPTPLPAAASAREPGFVVEIGAEGELAMEGVPATPDRLREALAKRPPAEVTIVRGASDAPFGRVLHLLDQAKQAGRRRFVLTVRDEPSRRTPTIELPVAGARGLPPPAMPGPAGSTVGGEIARMLMIGVDQNGVVSVDHAALVGPLRERLRSARAGASDELRAIVMADRSAPLGAVVDVTREAREEGIEVAFAVEVSRADNVLVGGVTSNDGAPSAASSVSRPRPNPKTLGACPFPPAADKAGIDTAVVTLRVKVDASGKPTDVLIVSEPGHGFGAAAKACTAKISFEPARDAGGRAVAGETVMRIRFER
ncbi:MAG: TonB family protein [Deltaproteobacteria bacterium]|nr:TonB family protein [Deltaproteobacteria bacterium]